MKGRDVAALVALAAIWGASYLFIRVAVDSIGPLPLAFGRVAVGAVCLGGYAVGVSRRAELPGLDRRFLFLGLFNAAVPYGLIAFSEQHLTASLAGILNATTPLFTAIVVALWSQEHLAGRTLLGMAFGMAGVAVLVGWNAAPLDDWMAISVAAMLLASLSYAVATAYAKRALTGVSSLGAATGQQMAAAVILGPLSVVAIGAGGDDVSPSAKAVLAVLALGTLCTAVAYLLYFHLIASAGAVNTSSVTFLIPVFGILWSALFLGESVHVSMIVGLGLILASVTMVTRMRIPRRRSQLAESSA